MFFRRLSFILALCLASGAAQAALVVDTGTPSNAVGSGWAFNGNHSYAGRFSVAGALTIDSISGYFSTDAGTVGVSLFSNSGDGDGGFIPGSVLQTASVATAAGALAWNGVSALDWKVGPGTYWVVFTSSYSAGSQSSMPGMAPQALGAYALMQGGQWYDASFLGLGQALRVDGALVSSVPEPAGTTMLIVGLAGIGALARRRKRG
ncbi:PEP-CTERM sorting domain-containing protein [Rugamonas sp. FT107W]|uniref:PEP-CTERM sorting domain-containing protein n=1 Tax=Duganella vulcania TaxID=2692166 RepID=A0A845HMQ5_9BURK|nr:PEP-CTERM sorting domain-containing protein [Duganella vulcania]MYN18723.1 PEP-CTERM sorting domain-containing protein [Duganella vulcania]